MKCMCNNEGSDFRLCVAHEKEFRRRAAAGLIHLEAKASLPPFFFEADVEAVSSTVSHGKPGTDLFSVQLRCVTQDESGLAEEHTVHFYTKDPPRVGQRYEVELKAVDG